MLTLFLAVAALSHPMTWERHNDAGFSAEATISAETVLLTDTLTVNLTTASPPGYSVDTKLLGNNLLDEKEASYATFKLQNIAQKDATIAFTLEPLELGIQYLTFHEIPFTALGQAKVILPSGMFRVEVTSIDEKFVLPVADVLPLDTKPILTIDAANELQLEKDAAELPEHNRQVFLDRSFPWHYFVVFPLTIVLVIGMARFVQLILRSAKQPNKEPTAAKVATQELKSLAESDLVAQGKFAEFYVQLTKTLRSYISQRYGIAASEMTTEEFLTTAMSHSTFDEQTRTVLSNLLAYADQVKFAKEPATPENCKTALAYAKTFISRS